MRHVKPAYFFRGDIQYVALSAVPQTINRPASEVTDAVSRGELPITMISGCKAVRLGDLFRLIDKREGPQ